MKPKFLLILMAVLMLTASVMALPTVGPYSEAWTTSNTNTNSVYKWIQAANALIEAGISLGTGDVFYLDSNVTNEGDGTDWANAVDTLNEAVALCTADNGDVILGAQGHAETLSAIDGADLDVAGITFIGLGSGDLRPTFTYSVAAGEIVIGADDVTICNIRCISSVTAVLKAIDIEAAAENAHIVNCVFDVDAAGTDEFNHSIVIGDASDKAVIKGCHFRQGAGGAVAAIYLDHDSDYTQIVDNVVFGDYSTACIVSDTAASDHLLIQGNVLFNGTIGGNAGLNSEPCIELLATTTGIIADNYVACNLATKAAAIVAADCYLFENYYNEDESGAATGGLIGTASADDG